MTEKTEHQGVATGAGEESDSKVGSAVPSIIVDPAVALQAAASVAASTSGDAGRANGGHPTVPVAAAVPVRPADNPGRPSALSDADADRFAASIRPSWEPPAGQDYAGDRLPPAAVAAAPGTAVAVPAPADDELRAVPGSQRRRGVLITVGAVLGFCALAALGLMASKTDAPAGRRATRPAGASAAAHSAQPKPAPTPKPVQAAPAASPAPAAAAPAVPPLSAVAVPAVPAPPLSAVAVPAAGAVGELPPAVTLVTTEPAATPASPAAPTPAVAAAPTHAPTKPPPVAATPSPAPAKPAIAAAPTHAPAKAPPVAAAPTKPAPVAAVPMPPMQAVAPAAAVTAPARAEPRTVRMHISARPSSAHITLDGSAIPNPFEADMIRGGKHRVKAHADGYRSADVMLSFDRDRDLDLVLDPIVAARPRPRPKARKARVQSAAADAPSPATRAAPAAESNAARGAGFVSESPY